MIEHESFIFAIPQSAWCSVTDSWFERMTKCVQADGAILRRSGVDSLVVSVIEKKQNIMSGPRMQVNFVIDCLDRRR